VRLATMAPYSELATDRQLFLDELRASGAAPFDHLTRKQRERASRRALAHGGRRIRVSLPCSAPVRSRPAARRRGAGRPGGRRCDTARAGPSDDGPGKLEPELAPSAKRAPLYWGHPIGTSNRRLCVETGNRPRARFKVASSADARRAARRGRLRDSRPSPAACSRTPRSALSVEPIATDNRAALSDRTSRGRRAGPSRAQDVHPRRRPCARNPDQVTRAGH
jgi:hypothetical protein